MRRSLALLWSGEAKLASHLEPGCASFAKHGYLVAGLAANFIYCSLRGGSSWKRYVRTGAYALRADLGNFLSAPVSGLKRGSVRMRGLSADIVAKVAVARELPRGERARRDSQARIRKKHCWFVGHCRGDAADRGPEICGKAETGPSSPPALRSILAKPVGGELVFLTYHSIKSMLSPWRDPKSLIVRRP